MNTLVTEPYPEPDESGSHHYKQFHPYTLLHYLPMTTNIKRRE